MGSATIYENPWHSDVAVGIGKVVGNVVKKHPYIAGTVVIIGGVVACYFACPVGFVAVVITTIAGPVTWASYKMSDILTKFGKSPTVQTLKFSQDALNKAVNYVTKDPTKMIHIFGNPSHKLDLLVKELGSKENVIQAVIKGLNSITSKIPESIVSDVPIKIGNYIVTARVIIIDGIPRLSTMFIK